AGKYVFRLADTSLHNVMQVYDANERHLLGQWFFVPVNRTMEALERANGKPVVMFQETARGITPPIKYFFYPTDLTGKEFIYPKHQALKIAAAGHEGILATDDSPANGRAPHVVRINPHGKKIND